MLIHGQEATVFRCAVFRVARKTQVQVGWVMVVYLRIIHLRLDQQLVISHVQITRWVALTLGVRSLAIVEIEDSLV